MSVKLQPIDCLPTRDRRRKRTRSGTGNRIKAPPAPRTCPVNVTGRYQSLPDSDGAFNLQINQAGDHIEFQLVPALRWSPGLPRQRWMIFGGGDFDAGSFNIYVYGIRGYAFDSFEGYLPEYEKDFEDAGSIETVGTDRVKLTLTEPTLVEKLGCEGGEVLGRFNGQPTPFTQSLPGLLRKLRRGRASSIICAGALWWPLLRFQKELLDDAVPQIKANIRAIIEQPADERMADRVYNLEKRLVFILTFDTDDHDGLWHPQDVPLCRLYLRRALAQQLMTIFGERKSVLAFMQEAIDLFTQKRFISQQYPHPLVPSQKVTLLRPDLTRGYYPEIPRFVRTGAKKFRYKAKLEAGTAGVDLGLAEFAAMTATLTVQKYALAGEQELYITTYEFVMVLYGGSAGVGVPSGISGTVAVDDAVSDSPYDWDAQDFAGLVVFGEAGAEAVDGDGYGLSEEALFVLGNDPSHLGLLFDFGDMLSAGEEGYMDNFDEKFGFSIGADVSILVGWLIEPKNLNERIEHQFSDVLYETEVSVEGKPVGFDFGSALLNAAGVERVGALAARELAALSNAECTLRIDTHADLVDDPEDNLELTGLRAQNTEQVFVDFLGDELAADVEIRSKGDLEALLANQCIDTEEADPRFRRADIRIGGRFVTYLTGAGASQGSRVFKRGE